MMNRAPFTQAMLSHSGKTWNDAVSHSTPDLSGKYEGRLSLFYKSVRGLNFPKLTEYLEKAAKEDLVDAFLLAFHIRDCRGGKGERNLGRSALQWLMLNHPMEFAKVIHLIPDYGRWDDLLTLFPKVLNLEKKNVADNTCSPTLRGMGMVDVAKNVQRQIVQFYADQLKKDGDNMFQGSPCSLAAKWAPTEHDSLDSKHQTVQTLSRVMGVSPRNYRKKYISPLRAYLKIVERYMCSKRWDDIEYSKVPSCAMNRLKKAFARNDTERFEEWKKALQKGEVEVKAKQLYPHELVKQYMNCGYSWSNSNKEVDPIVEAQWKVLEEETRKLGVFENSLVLSDVSGSMNGTPMEVSIALGIMISGATQEPFKNHVITFETNPKFCVLEDSWNLKQRVEKVQGMGWGGSTNIQAVFDLILRRAQQFNLSEDDMPKRLYILSDMQFNQADSGNLNTNYEVVKRKYADSGYNLPQIVFWNLNGRSTDFPVTTDNHGTIMISGFTTAILKSILQLGTFTPELALRATLDDERYLPVKQALTN
jgi:hypothetical protein